MKRHCFFLSKKFTKNEFLSKIRKLNEYSLDFSMEELTKKKNTELNLMSEIILRSLDKQLESIMPHEILRHAIKCFIKYGYQLRIQSQLGLSEKKCIRRYNNSNYNFRKLIMFYRTDYPEEIIRIVIYTINKKKLWLMRRLCFEMFICLYECGCNETIICNEICNIIETAPMHVLIMADYKSVTKILYQLLDIFKWSKTIGTELFIRRLMGMYFKSLQKSSDELYNPFYSALRGSLELGVTFIIRHIPMEYILIIIQQLISWTVQSDIDSKIILKYGNLLEYAAFIHKGLTLTKTFTPELFPLIMQMISSDIQFVSLLGNRVFQYMIDTNHNKSFFNSPRIFLPKVKIKFIKIKELNEDDVNFLTLNREIIHKSIIKSIINHRMKRSILETIYCTICLLAFEIPCGFSAAAICCIMMNLQDIIKKYPNTQTRESNYHIHAIIISVLSFICWMHNANDFHEYIKKIAMERGHWAPHLNPPLKTKYIFAAHHITYDKPELYLNDWEVRYGLWRKFRLDEKNNLYQNIDKSTSSRIIEDDESDEVDNRSNPFKEKRSFSISKLKGKL